MKTILLLALAASLHAAPILTVTGATPTAPNTFAFDLRAWATDTRTVTITSDVPLLSLTGWFDNLPNMPGSGMCFSADGARGACIGVGVLWQGQYTITSPVPFWSVVMFTKAPFLGGIEEHGTVSGLVGVAAVPEPHMIVLFLIALGVMGLGLLIRGLLMGGVDGVKYWLKRKGKW